MLDLDPKLKKKKGADYFAIDEDLDDEWVKQHQAFLAEEQRQKITKKFEKDNEKRVAEGEKEMKAKELEERLKAVKELENKYKKENKTKKVEAEGKGATVEKFENNVLKLDQRIENMTVQAEDKENNKEVALGTSKIVSTIWDVGIRLPIIQSLTESNNRTTLTHASLWFSRRNSTFLLKNSFPSHCVRSLTGPSNPWMKTGSFEHG